MLLVAIESLLTETEHSKVTTDTLPCTDVDVRERAANSGTSAFVEKVDTKWSPFRSRIVGEVARRGSTAASTLKEVPADSNLGGIMLIHASQATIAGSCIAREAKFEHKWVKGPRE